MMTVSEKLAKIRMGEGAQPNSRPIQYGKGSLNELTERVFDGDTTLLKKAYVLRGQDILNTLLIGLAVGGICGLSIIFFIIMPLFM